MKIIIDRFATATNIATLAEIAREMARVIADSEARTAIYYGRQELSWYVDRAIDALDDAECVW